jgi:biotin carboxyl carrier protein
VKLHIAFEGGIQDVEYKTLPESALESSGPTERAQSLVLPTPAISSQTDGDESKFCRAPIAGIVTRINVRPGQLVQVEDIVAVVEAMKMENNLVAAKEQKAKFVQVKTGDAVKAGQIVVEFE